MAIGAIVLLVVASLFRGFVFGILWQWFVTEYFGLPPLVLFEALGLAGMVSFVTVYIPRDETKKSPQKIGETVFIQILGALIVLGIGWIYHAFLVGHL